MNQIRRIIGSLKKGQMKDEFSGTACCPAHNDKNPSFSATLKDGKVLVHCFSGCEQTDVIEALKEKGLWETSDFLGLTTENYTTCQNETKTYSSSKTHQLGKLADSFADSRRFNEEISNFLINERFILEFYLNSYNVGYNFSSKRITIPIENEKNDVLEIREHKPNFLRYEGENKVIPNEESLDASQKLYPIQVLRESSYTNIPRLYKDISGKLGNVEIVDLLDTLDRKFLIVTEGELDALTAISHGVCAISKTCGADGWKDKFSETIAAAGFHEVIVCYDNDKTGVEGTIKCVESLQKYIPTVRKINWPTDRNKGHDITDEIKNYGIKSFLSLLINAEQVQNANDTFTESNNQDSGVIYLSDVVATQVEWCIKPFIALKKVTLLEGNPGIGKSYLSLYFSSLLSLGLKNPFDETQTFKPAKTLIMSAEDGLDDTIKPRLEKMEYDHNMIFAPREIFTLDDKGFKTLEDIIVKENPTLVVIDPMMPFLDGKKDSNKASDMRPFFKALSRIATQYNCAILVTRHLAKNPELKGVNRGLGSIDISAAVRSILQVNTDTKDKDLQIVSHIKSNISKKADDFGYRITDDKFTLENLIPKKTEAPVDDSELGKAKVFLTNLLKNGSMDANEVIDLATVNNISKSTLTRAKKAIDVRSKKITDSGLTELWQWFLPKNQQTQESQYDQDIHDIQTSINEEIKFYENKKS